MFRRVLFLKPGRLFIVCIDKTDTYVERCWKFSGSDLPVSVGLHLSAGNQHVYSMVLDIESEEGHFEKIPEVGFSDRKHLIKRLADKHFTSGLLSRVHTCGHRETGGVLVSGVVEDALLLAVLEVVKQSDVLLSAIDSPLTLARQLCKGAGRNNGPHLLVIRSDRLRFRVVACVDACPVFNRQINFDPEDSESLLQSITETLSYLKRCEISGWSAPIVTLFGVPVGWKDKIAVPPGSGYAKQICVDFPDTTVEQISEQQSVNSRSIDTLDKFFAQHSIRSGGGYAEKSHRHLYLRRKIRSVVVAALFSLTGGAISTVAVANKLEAEYQALSAQYQQTIESTNSLDLQEERYAYPVEAVRQALITARLIEMRSEWSPVIFLSELASVVSNESAISVSSVAWHQEDSLDQKSLQEIIDNSDDIEKMHMDQFFRATVSGSIEGNAASVLDRFETFVSKLRNTSAEPSVVVVEAPFGLAEDRKTTAADMNANDAVFVIDLVRRGELR